MKKYFLLIALAFCMPANSPTKNLKLLRTVITGILSGENSSIRKAVILYQSARTPGSQILPVQWSRLRINI
jgi:hypothetical protein